MHDTAETILDFILDFKKKHDYSPTIREIQDGCELSSTSVVEYHLDALIKDGAIAKDANKARSITLIGGKNVAE